MTSLGDSRTRLLVDSLVVRFINQLQRSHDTPPFTAHACACHAHTRVFHGGTRREEATGSSVVRGGGCEVWALHTQERRRVSRICGSEGDGSPSQNDGRVGGGGGGRGGRGAGLAGGGSGRVYWSIQIMNMCLCDQFVIIHEGLVVMAAAESETWFAETESAMLATVIGATR